MHTVATAPASPSPSGEATITIAGHLYSASQVHTFAHGAAILAGFFLLSYLALVVFPKFAARRYSPAPASAMPHRALALAPERPFAARPPATHAPKASTSEPPLPTPMSPPPEYHSRPSTPVVPVPAPPAPFTPAAWAATTRLHGIADRTVGAAPAPMPLAARYFPFPNDAQVAVTVPLAKEFPWVHETHDFGLVTRRIPASAYRTASFARPPSVVLLEGLARKLNLKYAEGGAGRRSVGAGRRPFSAVFAGARGSKVLSGQLSSGVKEKAASKARVGPGRKAISKAAGKENANVRVPVPAN
ncbi:hypothetical protein C8R46DRAFT_1361235 [Mycena filopes]|nr:hypothetical protein C8R46DRAFT_1361235 [Mycena filopes]